LESFFDDCSIHKNKEIMPDGFATPVVTHLHMCPLTKKNWWNKQCQRLNIYNLRQIIFFVIINLFYVIIMIANYHVTYIEILEVFTMSKWSTQNCIARMELGYIWAMWTLCWHSNNPCHFILFEIVSPYKIAFSFLNSQILPDFDITIYIRQTWWELSLCREYFLK
jgi:hypothetical protein